MDLAPDHLSQLQDLLERWGYWVVFVGMVLENATGLTVGGTTASLGNLLTATKGNGLWATGNLSGSGVYHVALVDDVLTTGATAREACGTLLRAGAGSVELWTLARTPEPCSTSSSSTPRSPPTPAT
jgi:hypothetical protein